MVVLDLPIYGNGTLVEFNCDINNLDDICQRLLAAFGTVSYVPTLPGNALYLAIFSVILLVQIGQGIIYRTWNYLICMILGLALEAAGYGARISMHYNPWESNPFLIQIITVTIGPIFFSACIYLCLSKLIILYDPENHYAHFRPRTYTVIFLSVDFLCLVLQATGGALADTANTQADSWNGVHIMIAGLALQVGSLLVFSVLCAHFTFRLVKAGVRVPDERYSVLRGRLGTFIIGLCLATLFVTVRSCFRVAELSNGFSGQLANEEVPFMVLESAMIVLATLLLTIFHPGRILGDQWRIKAPAANKESGGS